MAITVTAYTNFGASATQIDVTSVVVAAGDRIIMGVGHGGTSSSAFAGAWDPTGVNEVITVLHTGTQGAGATSSEYWVGELVVPSAGTFTARASWTTAANAAVNVLVIHGADTTVAGNTATGTAADGTPTVTIASATGRMTYTLGCVRDSTITISSDGDSTRKGEITSGSGASHARIWWWEEAGSASVTVSGTLSTAPTSGTWRLRGYDFIAASTTSRSVFTTNARRFGS